MRPDRKTSALIVIDVQNDFCPGGALAVRDGDAVIPPLNAAMSHFDTVILTQDWHPTGHVSFASSWKGRAVFDRVEVEGVEQTLWPDHCVAGTGGAEFHPDLDADRARLVLRKGFRRGLDSYSTFKENDRRTTTGLEGFLRGLGVSTLYLGGLATDYCVLFSGIDALEAGFGLVLLGDAIRGVDLPPGSAGAAVARLQSLGARLEDAGSLGGDR